VLGEFEKQLNHNCDESGASYLYASEALARLPPLVVHSLVGIAKREPVLPSVRMKLIATGAHNLRDPGVPRQA
jgi:hypothetical protein